MNKILELFGHTTSEPSHAWDEAVRTQTCPFLNRTCLKNRKSQPHIAIGTCTLHFGERPVVICPHRFLERRLIFTDCLQLVRHEPGNEIHIVPEVTIPGGTVDYFLVTARNGRTRDFAGIEIQTLDTTGTIWPERQRFLHDRGLTVDAADRASIKSFGMNWKHTSKTILMQLHHKVQTFESVNRHLVLAIQDALLLYIQREFRFTHITIAKSSDPLQIHSYNLRSRSDGKLSMQLDNRLSTDTTGVASALGLQQEARVELQAILTTLDEKLSEQTLIRL